ncbi:hypothetical protein PMG11_00977 [Penicillium brasilianum]|uniref:Uncharacterized protein n=1 Tax=Penicillium brasilianum TaxID=104259 RepID=A0A0F7TGN1_PENBI|nr:hypothetical protein PMG11_00977 [Penicillium brasilianum]
MELITAWIKSLRGDQHIELVSTGRDGFLIDKEILLPFFEKFSAIQSWTIFLPSVSGFAHINLNTLIGLWQNRDAPPPCIDQATNAIALFLDEAAKRQKALSEAGKTYRQLVTRGRNSIRRDRASGLEREALLCERTDAKGANLERDPALSEQTNTKGANVEQTDAGGVDVERFTALQDSDMELFHEISDDDFFDALPMITATTPRHRITHAITCPSRPKPCRIEKVPRQLPPRLYPRYFWYGGSLRPRIPEGTTE